MIVLHQLAGLGIRHKRHRMLVWAFAVVAVSVLTAVSIALGALGCAMLFCYTIWKLAVSR